MLGPEYHRAHRFHRESPGYRGIQLSGEYFEHEKDPTQLNVVSEALGKGLDFERAKLLAENHLWVFKKWNVLNIETQNWIICWMPRWPGSRAAAASTRSIFSALEVKQIEKFSRSSLILITLSSWGAFFFIGLSQTNMQPGAWAAASGNFAYWKYCW